MSGAASDPGGPALTSPYRVPLEQLERGRVARADQVVLTGDGAGPPAPGPVGSDAADGDGD